jgi:hypothetical protein
MSGVCVAVDLNDLRRIVAVLRNWIGKAMTLGSARSVQIAATAGTNAWLSAACQPR